MGYMDAAMIAAVASSFILSTTPFGTSDCTILITAPLFVSLPAGKRGKSNDPLLSPCPFLSPFVFGMQTYSRLSYSHKRFPAQIDLDNHQQRCW